MAISVGIGTQGSKRIMRLTLGGSDLAQIQELWGERPRLVFSAQPVEDGRWLLTFQPRDHGNIGGLKLLTNREYLTFVWTLKPDELLGLAPSSSSKGSRNIYGSLWDKDALVLTVNGVSARKPVTRDIPPKRKPAPKPIKEKPVMSFKKTATYDLGKITSGSVRYEWASGDKGLGTLYIRKEDVGGEPPKRITITLAAID